MATGVQRDGVERPPPGVEELRAQAAAITGTDHHSRKERMRLLDQVAKLEQAARMSPADAVAQRTRTLLEADEMEQAHRTEAARRPLDAEPDEDPDDDAPGRWARSEEEPARSEGEPARSEEEPAAAAAQAPAADPLARMMEGRARYWADVKAGRRERRKRAPREAARRRRRADAALPEKEEPTVDTVQEQDEQTAEALPPRTRAPSAEPVPLLHQHLEIYVGPPRDAAAPRLRTLLEAMKMMLESACASMDWPMVRLALGMVQLGLSQPQTQDAQPARPGKGM